MLARYDDAAVAWEKEITKRVAMHQRTNARGHVFLSKFLLFGIASKEFKEEPALLTSVYAVVAEDMSQLFEVGVQAPGKGRFFGAYLGMEGDLKYHHQIGHLERSYYNLGRRHEYPICHLCSAGENRFPFESVHENSEWESSLFLSEPWPEDSPPAIASIPFDPMCRAAAFRLDPFHLWKVGLGRDLTGSGIVVLCQLGKFDFGSESSKNIDDRLARAHSCFRPWCLGSGKTPALRSFTKNNLNCPDRLTFAWGSWKGSDNTLITKWLLFYITNQMTPGDDAQQQSLFDALSQTLSSALTFWSILHSHGLWLDRVCARRLQHHLARTLRGYKVCASRCHALQLAGFSLKPKLHGLAHVNHDLLCQIKSEALFIISPSVFNCESNEDMVGRVSCPARRVSARLVNTRVMERILCKTKALIRRRKRSQSGAK